MHLNESGMVSPRKRLYSNTRALAKSRDFCLRQKSDGG